MSGWFLGAPFSPGPLVLLLTYHLSDSTLVGRRFAHQRFADSRELIRANRFKKKNLFLKHLARFARIASSLRFAFKFAWFASFPRCYPFSGRSIRKRTFFRSKNRFARIDPLRSDLTDSQHGCRWSEGNAKRYRSVSQMWICPPLLGLESWICPSEGDFSWFCALIFSRKRERNTSSMKSVWISIVLKQWFIGICCVSANVVSDGKQLWQAQDI